MNAMDPVARIVGLPQDELARAARDEVEVAVPYTLGAPGRPRV
jgi:hypothetical protein